MTSIHLAGRAVTRAAAVLAFAATLLAPMAAHAGAGVMQTTVSALSDTVTYSIPGSNPLVTYIGYQVNIANAGGNTINNVRFTATATDPVIGQTAVFSSVEGGTCVVTNVEGTAIECSIGQLKALEAAAPFRVFFTAPARAAGNTLPNGDIVAGVCSGDCVTLQGITYYAEGTGGANSVPQNSTELWTPVPVALGTANPTRVKSAVPKAGGNFYTGNGGLASDADKFASSVRVPLAQSSTTAEILETPFGLTLGCTNFESCYESVITVPTPAGAASFNPYLSITLRMDATNIKSGTKIETVMPTYNGEVIALCANATTPRSDFKPCIASRTAYGKGNNVLSLAERRSIVERYSEVTVYGQSHASGSGAFP